MVEVAEQHGTFAHAFDAFRRQSAFGGGGLGQAREAAFDRFSRRGLPTTRDEEWRFTNIAPIAQAGFRPVIETRERDGHGPGVAPEDLASWSFPADVRHTAVLVNGQLAPELSTLGSLPDGLTVHAVRDARGFSADAFDGSAFVDLNRAFVEDVLLVEVAAGAVVTEPLHVLCVTAASGTPLMSSPRIVIRAGERSQVAVVESYAGSGKFLSNGVTEVMLEAGAMVDHVKFQRQPATSFHVGSMFVRLGRGATFVSHALTLGGRIARNDVVSVLDGDGAECTLNGLYVAGGDGLVDNHTTIDHARPHCPSHEVYKGILTGRARAVFNGKIVVRPDAQKTNAKQTNKALLLSDDAQINTKPQLEIFADDVKCTHGAAIGQLDEDALFYLRARGIGTTDARNMLIHAFAGQVLDGIRIEEVRAAAMRLVEVTIGLAH